MTKVFRIFRNLLALVGLCLIAGIFFSWLSLSHLHSPPEDEAIGSKDLQLELTLRGKIVEKRPSQALLSALSMQMSQDGPQIVLSELVEGIDQAAKDERVNSFFVNPTGIQASLPQVMEIHAALQRAKDQGKKIYFWMERADTNIFALSSLADFVYMPPLGDLSIPGPVFQSVYFGEAMSSLGIGFDIVRAGRYKSAFEPFVLKQPSAEMISMLSGLELNLRSYLESSIAESKGTSVEDSHQWLKSSLFSAPKALEEGLINGIAYLDSAKSNCNPEDKLQVLSFSSYRRQTTKAPSPNQADAIALIIAQGEIREQAPKGSDDVITSEKLIADLRWAREEEHIKAVVLRVDSPGGSALASDLIAMEVKKLADTKPILVSMGSVAASGGYYISAYANKIFASPSTITGSIGVIGLIPNVEKISKKYGVHFHTLTESDRAKMLNPGKKLSRSDKKALQDMVDQTYQAFLSTVSEGRSLDYQHVENLAEGKVYSGSQALDIGLVDELGDLWSTINEANRLAQTDEGAAPLPVKQRPDSGLGLIQCLIQTRGKLQDCLTGDGSTASWMALPEIDTPVLGNIRQSLMLGARWLDAANAQQVLTLEPTVASYRNP